MPDRARACLLIGLQCITRIAGARVADRQADWPHDTRQCRCTLHDTACHRGQVSAIGRGTAGKASLTGTITSNQKVVSSRWKSLAMAVGWSVASPRPFHAHQRCSGSAYGLVGPMWLPTVTVQDAVPFASTKSEG